MFYDIAIIGAGPSALAVAARLHESTPSALFTNDEHARYWKKYKQQRNRLESERKRRKSSVDSVNISQAENIGDPGLDRPSMIVLDAHSDQWLSAWKKRFRDLKISHLRSPLFFHPDPRDRDGLLAFAHEHNRTDELHEIPNVAGKELSKHEKKKQHSRKRNRPVVRHLKIDGRDRMDYFNPSSQLFEDYCEYIIDRYKLRNLVHRAQVLDITYDTETQNTRHGLFTVKTSTSSTILSRIVVVATGPSTVPAAPGIPPFEARGQSPCSMTHVFQPNGTHLPPALHHKIMTTSYPIKILIVGGGLTSAQVVHLLLHRYRKQQNFKIHLLLRHSRLKVKPFDIDLPWVSKTRNYFMASFYSAESDEERLSMLAQARNGGSVTPQFAKLLQNYEAEGRLKIHTDTEIELDRNTTWDSDQQEWRNLRFKNSNEASGCGADVIRRDLPGTAHHIIFCTSSTPSLPHISFLRNLQETHPLRALSGLPILTEDLAWSDGVPCFFTGVLAALRLGPGAANLMGARIGAERIAWAVEASLVKAANIHPCKSSAEEHQEHNDRAIADKEREGSADSSDFTGSFTNQFAVLSLDGDPIRRGRF
ncbi:hypothetical protein H2198_002251 [Neophaeococcomyces mojaviensis]|uniref:Uncharacterized protein n=1 Tax=Neophaeococcomyces mojaviensis TaxID=3383035 RepID=A0ACC3AF26_9EURO|nr:hypothetical protein H2198_002251 [Knufia sp. JES_112]